ncbi:VOC family protein [Bythopirellula goksoeyrii]|uniref:Bleomycin resistance protein n=1 Tax=Bythopirellula goksoeyrii TaxID=1400387 RepID=A0A5B9QUW2_9BACT|nr:VOC family protein [Bythopirellula goksoeyrii]QEG37791.1 Bleomycin resistance protein [Bythopirellula goksoeyrii]
MASLLAVSPVLLVHDVVAAAEYYREKLGFSYDRFWGEPPNFCMVRRDGLTVMLSQVGSHTEIVPHWQIVDKMWNANFWVDDVEALYTEFQQNDAKIDYSLHLKPYGVKEFGIQDIDGHDIAFGQIVEE